MDALEMDNDTRGWIMCLVSGAACVAGSLVICVDSLVRLVPGFRSFEIAKSSAFLAASLSLSFGVMIFSSLYSMLPTSRKYFAKAGFSAQAAGLWLMFSFAVGFLGIQVISRLFHQLMPSHVVDCDHTHGGHAPSHSHFPVNIDHSHGHHHSHDHDDADDALKASSPEASPPRPSESTPLLRPSSHQGHHRPSVTRIPSYRSVHSAHRRDSTRESELTELNRRPSLLTMPTRVMSFVKDTKPNCDEIGPCYGYTDPCGQECYKHLNGRPILRTTTGTTIMSRALEEEDEIAARAANVHTIEARAHDALSDSVAHHHHHHHHHHDHLDTDDADGVSSTIDPDDLEAQQHHHHVPTNAFMSIGLQTAIAIAIHKFPEGFITWASNHANPDLGFNVFMALFTHNIAEGFALAMPLFLALGSKTKAILWTFVLGGLSQPVGAMIAVFWFRATHQTPLQPNNTVYAALFAGTAGIMVSVGMNLFVESLSMNHNRNLTIGFAVLGMFILGLSNALVAS
ncbi:putative zip zinc transporter protein [Zalerion maritima]|uniref:Zip zinc transporter protein n=1 Tax=Zalerion maritima TaxID=339359 RepID=A0AAD5RZQ4_9PEZI|nr:putative zip zinc transporter protein [Zalerion maritima]